MGNRDKQIELISKAISLNPYVPAYHRNLGAGYYSQKEYLKAIESHLRAVEIEPGNGVNYHNLGSAFFRLKEYKKAI
jgi:tetratricopeptide (TPR) repeat protein